MYNYHNFLFLLFPTKQFSLSNHKLQFYFILITYILLFATISLQNTTICWDSKKIKCRHFYIKKFWDNVVKLGMDYTFCTFCVRCHQHYDLTQVMIIIYESSAQHNYSANNDTQKPWSEIKTKQYKGVECMWKRLHCLLDRFTCFFIPYIKI